MALSDGFTYLREKIGRVTVDYKDILEAIVVTFQMVSNI